MQFAPGPRLSERKYAPWAICNLGEIRVIWVMGVLADSGWSGPARDWQGKEWELWNLLVQDSALPSLSFLTQPVLVSQEEERAGEEPPPTRLLRNLGSLCGLNGGEASCLGPCELIVSSSTPDLSFH